MQAKIDTLRVKDDSGEEYLLYPKTLMQCVTDEDGNTLANELSDIKAQLPENIDARFLTADGYGGLRYYNGSFQYYDTNSSTWVDAQATTDNSLLVTLAPQPMKSFITSCDPDTLNVELLIDESPDTIVDSQVLCVVEKIIIRRKKDGTPTDETDGDLVLEIERKDFGTYNNRPYVDAIDGVATGDVYYYKAFPVSNAGIIVNLIDNESVCVIKDYFLYGFRIDQAESDPASMITYIEDNANYQSAYMNYATDTFDYGSWSNAWFIKNLKPVMLNYDGTVAYELNRDDYSLKADGTASDIANASFGGNAMIGFPKIYWKIVDNGDDTANVYFSNKKVDDDFHCWSHIDNNGNEIDYCYMPIYNGSSDSTRVRSISGVQPLAYETAQSMINYAVANNPGDDIIWYTETFSDRMLVNLLLLLIGKSTDTQTIFGNGYYTGGSQDTYIYPGSMDTKGLFWGSNTADMTGVKVFGMEHWWGHMLRYIAGWINDNGVLKIKLTHGQFDGSTTDGYNLTGDGYIETDWTVSGSTGGYSTKMEFSTYGLIPIATGGSNTTYYTDGLWYDNAKLSQVLVGGASSHNFSVGALAVALNFKGETENWHVSTSVSCKPLLSVFEES